MSSSGYVLVGGRSARMGRDKALLTYRGRPLAAQVAASVAAAAGSATLVGDPLIYASLGYTVIPDIRLGVGPLGGIETALAHTGSDWNLMVACDMPALSAAFLGRLLEEAAKRQTLVLVPIDHQSQSHPLAAAWHRDAGPMVGALLVRGVRKVREALDELPVAYWRTGDLSDLGNVNTPADWAAYAAD